MGPLLAEAGSWAWNWVGIVGIPALVALNALFVAAEFSLVAVRKTRIEELQAQGVPGAGSVAHALKHLDRTIAATQLGVTLASIGLGWASESALADVIEMILPDWPPPWNVITTHTIAIALAFLFITFTHVVFGEFIPKTMSLQSPDRIALWLARPLNVFAKLTRPLTLLMVKTGNGITRSLGYRAPSGEGLVHSIEELTLLIEDTEEAGVLHPEQADLVQAVFRLSDKTVRDCMVPRDRMATLELSMNPEKVLEKVRAGAHTRMPVYESQLNSIVGIVNTKDLFYLFSLRGVVILEDAMYPPLFLKPDESVANALRLFRKAKRPMALVRDDDGAILGLITLEDILEEIIGDIEDEHDRPTPKVAPRRPVKVTQPRPPERKPLASQPPSPTGKPGLK